MRARCWWWVLLAGLIVSLGITVSTTPVSSVAPAAYFDIRDYGALDTAADNATAIQAALDAAAPAKGTVLVPPGTWRTTRLVRMAAGVTLTGTGAAASVIQATTPAQKGVYISNGSSVRDLALNGPNSNDLCATAENAIDSGTNFDVVIDRLEIRNWGCYAILLATNSARWSITNSKIINSGDGVNLTGGVNDVLVQGNWFESNPFNGLDINGSRNRIIGNHFLNNGTARRGSDNSGVLVWQSGGGKHADDNVISGNISKGNFGAGISITATGGSTVSHTVVSGNHVEDNGSEGIRLGGTDHSSVTGNTSVRSGTYGIAILDGAKYDVVSNNQVNDSKVAGIITTTSQTTSPMILGNQVGPSTGRGIWLIGGTNVKLRNNLSISNTGGNYSNSANGTSTDGGL